MGTPKYDNFEFAVLADALFTAEQKAREGHLTSEHIAIVLREMSHVLEVLLEKEAATSCLNISNSCYTDLDETKEMYEDLQKGVDKLLEKFDIDEESLESAADELMLIPEGYTEEEVTEIIAAHEAREESEG
jgi:hypothetical protein